MRNLNRMAIVIGGILSLFILDSASGIANAADAVKTAGAELMYAPGASRSCVKCHDDAKTATILHTGHAQKADPRTPFADKECESCHGASPEHRKRYKDESLRPPPAISFGKKSKTPMAEQNKVCLDCHSDVGRMNWQTSLHNEADTGCASCHSTHTLKDKVRVKATQAAVCYNCHKSQRSQAAKFSHHPINEGKVVCSDCHSPHGSVGPKQLVQANVNDTCFQCHAEKRGPFLWEHTPVAEDCSNCHTPHGSVQPAMLSARAPFLCQNCHSESFHPGTLYSGRDLVNGNKVLGKSCQNCHVMVHGSNHPSGARFTR